MYIFCLIFIALSVVILTVEAMYVFKHLSSKMHGLLLLYLISAALNNAGYFFEMSAKTSEVALIATKMLYLGKVMVPISLLLFLLRFCRIKLEPWIQYLMFSVHILIWILVCTTERHHLYYTTIEFVDSGMFPHNQFGHGPLYWGYQAIPLIYAIASIVIAIRAIKIMKTKEEKRQLIYLVAAPILSLVGLVFFWTGITNGFDTTNVGFLLCSFALLIALFRYKLVDTEDIVKSSMIDDFDDGIVVVDAYDNVSYANRTACRLLPGLTIGRKMTDSDVLIDLDRRSRNGERLDAYDKVYALSERPLYQNSIYRGEVYLMDDITDSVEYTNKIALERDRADEANATKSNFLSNMSHEIRTPMNAIVGMTDIMLRGRHSDEDKFYLESIKSSGSALLAIINDILDFSKIESGKMEIVNDEYYPLPLVEELKMMFMTRIGDKPVKLMYEIDENLPAKLYGDSVRIRQIIINFVNNAIKFTEVGYVRLKMSVEPISDDNINLTVAVEDSGSGIKPEDKEKLFNAFSQVDTRKNHAKEGTGLGLAISKNLVDLMNGTIGVESEYGSGSTFSFTIPQKVLDATPANRVEYHKEDENFLNFTAKNANILLVEDNEINVKVAQGLFAPLGFHMDVAENGLVSLKRVSENHYDLILMDHLMPVMDGIEATQKIRSFDGEYFKTVPIIALTANAIASARDEYFSAGMNDFIGKPINLKELAGVLRKWLPAELIEENTIGVSMTEGALYAAKEASNMLWSDMDKKDTSLDDALENIVELSESESQKEDKKMSYGELDRSVGIQYCGTEELYESVLEDFYRLIDSKSAKIEDLWHGNDIRNYTIEVHALKSTARMIGASELSELAFAMEQAGNANDLDSINEKTPVLMEMYRAYKDTLSYFDGGAVANSDKEEVPASVIKGDILKMNMAAKDFDIDAIDECMKKLSSYKMPNAEAEEVVAELDNLVRDVALEDIKTMTVKLMKLI